jgi:hypothetical protein
LTDLTAAIFGDGQRSKAITDVRALFQGLADPAQDPEIQAPAVRISILSLPTSLLFADCFAGAYCHRTAKKESEDEMGAFHCGSTQSLKPWGSKRAPAPTDKNILATTELFAIICVFIAGDFSYDRGMRNGSGIELGTRDLYD